MSKNSAKEHTAKEHTAKEHTVKRLIPVALAVLPLLITTLTLNNHKLAANQRLATHWNSRGDADGFSTVERIVRYTWITAVIVALLLLVLSALPKRFRASAVPAGIGIIAFMGFIFNMAFLDSIRFTDLANPEGTPGPGVARLAIVILPPLAASAIALWASAETQPPLANGPHPTIDLAADEHAVWFATQTSRLMTVPAIALTLATCATALVLRNLWILALIPVCATLAVLGRITVRVDRRGLTVSFGWSSLIRVHIDSAKIASAETIQVNPMTWGGWGYRGSIRLMRRAAVVLRKGPGIKVSLVNGAVFAVTVDHPEEGVALLNTFAGAPIPQLRAPV